MTLRNVTNVTINGVKLKMLAYLTQLFPNEFDEQFCIQLLEILKILVDNLTATNKVAQGELLLS